MALNGVLFSRASDEWETPQALYDLLDREFGFSLDPAATDTNHKCSYYYTKAEDGLTQSWANERVFLNPPYSQVRAWMRKAREESQRPGYCGAIVVCLVPSRTDTLWWHEDVLPYAAEVRFIRGRLRFGRSDNSAPFPSAIVIYVPQGEPKPCPTLPVMSSLEVPRMAPLSRNGGSHER